MYQTVDEFLKDWNEEAQITQKELDVLTDESLQQQVAPGHHKLGELGWHLAGVLGFFSRGLGIQFEGIGKDASVPASAEEIAATYKRLTADFAKAIKEQWKDSDLAEEVTMMGQQSTKNELVKRLLNHQTHHRGQMTVLMRQAGLVVPGVYGPSKEEMEAMKK
ncbi:DinB family protein [Bacillus sp. 1P06AnD]|uniref:DinB family protein n=1 Tax=Bacillus sp. 1P06AnD TaxID=3132208 RepID=UPI0039A38B05